MDTILNKLPCGYLEFNDEGILLQVNNKICDVVNRRREEIIDSHIETILTPGAKVFYQTYLFPMLKMEEKVNEVYLTLRTNKGEDVPVLINAERSSENNTQTNRCIIVQMKSRSEYEDRILNDKNDMSELNNELVNTKRVLTKKTTELEHSNELKNQMMGMAAHDLRNPLTLIQNYALFLIDDHQEESIFTEDQYHLIKEIKGSSEYMVQIIEDMLDISSFESGCINLKKENYNLVELVEDAVSLSRSSANKKDIIVTTHLPDSSVNKVIDAHKIRQVVDNLLSNAIKYSNPETEVEIGISHTNEAEGVTVFVKDHGQGIPEDEIDKLFDPFSQISVKATAGEKSTGLGLAIVQKIVEAHGGKIEVDSKVGVGSTFIIEIP